MEFVDIYVPTSRVPGINLRRAKTIKIPKYEYDAIRNLIIETLESENEVSLEKLITKGVQKLVGVRQVGQMSWLIIQVKNDLEFREQIQSSFDDSRNQLIKLRSRKRNQLTGT
jgi:hypothetical protein